MLSYFLIVCSADSGFDLQLRLRVSLRRVAISELKSQGQAIVELVSKQGIGNEQWQNPVLFRRNMHMIDGVSDADIYILSGNGNLIYRTQIASRCRN